LRRKDFHRRLLISKLLGGKLTILKEELALRDDMGG
jgi:hypothetical protein